MSVSPQQGMDRVNKVIDWYQKKIGTYDKQLWEKSVEQRIIKGIQGMQNVPKKSGKVKAEFIDVDLVRGSAFTKAKPQCSSFAIARKGLIRVFMLPFYYKWWRDQTSFKFWLLMQILYVCQITSMLVYFLVTNETDEHHMVQLSDVFTPLLLLFVLGVLHSQIVSTHFSRKTQRQEERLRKRNERNKRRKSRPCSSTQSEHESGSQDLGTEATAGDNKQTSLLRRALQNEGAKVISSQKKSHKAESRNSNDLDRNDTASETESQPEEKLPKKSESLAKNSSAVKKWCQISKSTKAAVESDCTDEERLSNSGSRCHTPIEINGKETTHSESDTEIVSGATYMPRSLVEEVSSNTQEETTMLSMPVANTVGEILIADNGKFCLDNSVVVSLSDDKIENLGVSDDENPLKCCHGESRVYSPALASKSNISREFSCSPKHHSVRRSSERSDTGAERSDLSSSCEVEMKHDSSIEADRPIPNITDDNDSGAEESTVQIRVTAAQDQDGRSDNSSTNKRRLGSGQTVRRRRRSNLKVNINQESGKTSSQSKRKLPDSLPVKIRDMKESTGVSSCESEADSAPNTPTSSRKAATKRSYTQLLNVRLHQKQRESSNSSDGPMSEAEWDRMNSDMATSDTSSCTSGSELSDERETTSSHDDPFYWSHSSQHAGSVVHNSHTPAHDKVSCYIWEGEECQKVDLTVLDIGWIIIEKVDKIPETADYLFFGFLFSVITAFTPAFFRLYHQIGGLNLENLETLGKVQYFVFGQSWVSYIIVANGMLQRMCLASVLFFLLSVAERTFKQRLWYAKHFCYLTSSRRARKYDLPHFRLNKVRNIKTWLSLRSYLKKRGPQRSVDVIVSAAFVLAITLVALMCVQLLKDTESFLDQIYNWELGVWSMTLCMYLLRFMTLGTKVNKKYRNLSVLITEQINLYLHMEQKPHKKEELMLANNVLKLAEDLLKELESPFKISGLSANPFLYNITKVVILSAFSAVLTELLGFKLKLYKIKLRT